jgi:hypothetical protein
MSVRLERPSHSAESNGNTRIPFGQAVFFFCFEVNMTVEKSVSDLQAVGQVKGWKVQQIVFVGGTFGSVHVESFNKNMKALGVLESQWDPIRKKLVRRLLEEQDKVLRS